MGLHCGMSGHAGFEGRRCMHGLRHSFGGLLEATRKAASGMGGLLLMPIQRGFIMAKGHGTSIFPNFAAVCKKLIPYRVKRFMTSAMWRCHN